MTMLANQPTAEKETARSGARQALWLWLVATLGIVAAKLGGQFLPILGRNVKAVAVLLFLYLPAWAVRRRGERLEEYGLPEWPWRPRAAAGQLRRDLAWGLGTCLLLLVPVSLGFFALLAALPLLPEELIGLVIPYRPGALEPAFRLPASFGLLVLDQLLAVALPEELFFRGYLQTRLRRAWGEGRRRLLGVPVGRAFWTTQLLFALSHLGDLNPWRLWVFFPAILFGWLREKTDSIGAAVLVHAFCNLLLMVLEASAFGA